jgi:hypothetical protein
MATPATTMGDLDALFGPPLAATNAPPPSAAPPPPANAPPANATPATLDQLFAPPAPTAPAAAPAPTGDWRDYFIDQGNLGNKVLEETNKRIADDAAAAKKMLSGADTTTGAPWQLRMEVGAAPTEADRLAAVRKYYPDAEAVPGTSNFVYTNPATGKRTSMQQVGLPWYEPSAAGLTAFGGDVASGVGMIGGGLLGGGVGSFGGPAGTAVGGIVGGGAGAAAGREAYRRGLAALGYDVTDTRTPAQMAGDMALEAGINMAIPAAGKYVVGPIVGDILKAGAGTATQAAARSLDAAGVTDNLATKLPAGVASESPRVQSAEGALTYTLGGSPTRKAYTATADTLEQGAQKVAQDAAGTVLPPTPATFATRVGDIAENMYDKFKALRTNLDTQATNLIGAGRPVDLTPLRALRQNYLDAINRGAPPSDYQAALDRLTGIIDAADRQPGGTLDYGTMRAWRTNIGKDSGFEGAPSTTIPATGIPAMRNVYGAVNGVLGDTARAAGSTAEAAFNLYNNTVSTFRSNLADPLSDLMDPAKRANRLISMARNTAPADQQAVANFFASPYLDPAQRGELVGGFINQLGAKGNVGSEAFDMPTWLGNYNAMSPTVKASIFGNTGSATRDALDQLATVQGQVSQAGKRLNFSNTAYAVQILQALGALGTGLAQAVTGNLKGAAVNLGGQLGGPLGAGKLLQSAPFVRWLSGTYGVDPANTTAVTAALARLSAIGANDPTIAPSIAQLKARLTGETQTPAPAP